MIKLSKFLLLMGCALVPLSASAEINLANCEGSTIVVKNSTDSALNIAVSTIPSGSYLSGSTNSINSGDTYTWTVEGGKNGGFNELTVNFTFGSSDQAYATGTFQPTIGQGNCNLGMTNTNSSTMTVNKSKSGHNMGFDVCTKGASDCEPVS